VTFTEGVSSKEKCAVLGESPNRAVWGKGIENISGFGVVEKKARSYCLQEKMRNQPFARGVIYLTFNGGKEGVLSRDEGKRGKTPLDGKRGGILHTKVFTYPFFETEKKTGGKLNPS